jgi:hypothetical protein
MGVPITQHEKKKCFLYKWGSNAWQDNTYIQRWNPEANMATKLASDWTYRTGETSK